MIGKRWLVARGTGPISNQIQYGTAQHQVTRWLPLALAGRGFVPAVCGVLCVVCCVLCAVCGVLCAWVLVLTSASAGLS